MRGFVVLSFPILGAGKSGSKLAVHAGAYTVRHVMPDDHISPAVHTGRYQTWDGQLVVVLYRIDDHWYGHFAGKDPKHHIEKWNRDGTHVSNPDWNLKILEFDE